MDVIDAAVDAEAAIPSWASQCDKLHLRKSGTHALLRLLGTVAVFLTMLCAHPQPAGKRAPNLVQTPGLLSSLAAAHEHKAPAVKRVLARGRCRPIFHPHP